MLDLFERLIADGEAGILRLIEDRTQESVSLEFKTKERADLARFETTDRKNFGKALAGLANSQGGLLIWGIKARRDRHDDVDCAREAAPVAHIEAFHSFASELVGQLLTPRHDGIRLGCIKNQDGRGYLLVLVERSDRRPHMSMADHRYYRRAGGSTFPMEHGDIEDAFNRRSVSRLCLNHRVMLGMTGGSDGIRQRFGLSVQIGLSNDSKVSARYAYLYARVSSPPFGKSGSLHNGIFPLGWNHESRGDGWHRFGAPTGVLIHPSELTWVASVNIEVERLFGLRQDLVADQPLSETVFTLPVRFGSVDARMVEEDYTIRDVAAALPPWAG